MEQGRPMTETKKEGAGNRDLGHMVIVALKVAGWVLLLVAGGIVGMAKPQMTTIADKIYQTARKPKWDMELIGHIVPVLIAGTACTLIGLGIYYLGARDKKYGLPVSLIVTGLISVVGLVTYFLKT